MEADWVAFLGISAVVICTPGQDTALTIRNTLLGGRTAGIATALGVAVGQATWALAASLGLAALLIASEPAFAAVRLVGAAYLVILGIHSIRAAMRPAASADRGDSPAVRTSGGTASTLAPRRALRQGAVSNLGNPKMAIFFTSLLPQFIGGATAGTVPMLSLGLVFALMTLSWLSGYAVVIARLGDLLRLPRIRRSIDAVMGGLLVLFGVRLATERG
jgi:threonine/homoserine/homoserine lactone efflux protein